MNGNKPRLVDETGDNLGRVLETRLVWSGDGKAEYTVLVDSMDTGDDDA